ncbi:hypothetical protein, partial [Proteus mirabilis]|uniref:hypothetical protein n=1 Tax=Proteus mirabilis TaxID=584 RepID=UPI001952FE53
MITSSIALAMGSGWLGGFLHQATLGFTWEASVGYGAMFTAAVVAANAGSWWLVDIFAGCLE